MVREMAARKYTPRNDGTYRISQPIKWDLPIKSTRRQEIEQMRSITEGVRPNTRFSRHIDEVGGYTEYPLVAGYPHINIIGLGNAPESGARAIVSSTGGGYLWTEDSPGDRRITKHKLSPFPDSHGRFAFFREVDSQGKQKGEPWSLGYNPVMNDLDGLEARHEADTTVIRSRKGPIDAQLQVIIPNGKDSVELHRYTMTNRGNKAVTLEVTTLDELCKYDTVGDSENIQRTMNCGAVRVRRDHGRTTLLHTTEVRHGGREHFSFVTDFLPTDDTCGDLTAWAGTHRDLGRPYGVFRARDYRFPKEPRNTKTVGYPAAINRKVVTIAPGETIGFHTMVGYVKAPAGQSMLEKDEKTVKIGQVLRLNRKYSKPEALDRVDGERQVAWDEKLSALKVIKGDKKLKRATRWNQVQCLMTYILARGANFFENGQGRGMGFRDANQDLLGYMHLLPRQLLINRIKALAATQMPDGGSYHQYSPRTGKGDSNIGKNFGDDPLWLMLSVAAYIKETGDTSILRRKVGFAPNPDIAESKQDCRPVTILEHLRRANSFIVDNLGEHGLPITRFADWNDCNNESLERGFKAGEGKSFQCGPQDEKYRYKSESVMIAGLFMEAMPDYINMLELAGRYEEARAAGQARDDMAGNILKYAVHTEGKGKTPQAWFKRGTDRFGRWMGTPETPYSGGHICLEAILCAMAGVGKEQGLPTLALEATQKYLFSRHGHGYALNYPTYQKYEKGLIGEQAAYPAGGEKENGGIFCHANTWAILAGIREGSKKQAELAWKAFKAITPIYFDAKRLRLHEVEELFYTQVISGDKSGRAGVGRNSVLTGAGAWMLKTMMEGFFGLQPVANKSQNGLRIDPTIPAEWGKTVEIQRKFRGDTLKITYVKTTAGTGKGVTKMVVDGKVMAGNFIPAKLLKGNGTTHEVKVYLG
jgi:cellobiose phosphorylase